MEIIKVATFSEENKTELMIAGKLLGDLKRGFEDKSIDKLDTASTDLLKAIIAVVKEVSIYITEEN